jgi:hypothetical protein
VAAAYVPLSFAEAYQFDGSHEVVLLGGVTEMCSSRARPLCSRSERSATSVPRCSAPVPRPGRNLGASARGFAGTMIGLRIARVGAVLGTIIGELFASNQGRGAMRTG